MSKETGIIVGSIIFAVLGVIAAIVFFVYIGMKSPPQAVSANRKYFGCYLEWAWSRCWSRRSVCGLCGCVRTCTRWTRLFSPYWPLTLRNDPLPELSYHHKPIKNNKRSIKFKILWDKPSEHPRPWFFLLLMLIVGAICVLLDCFSELIYLPQEFRSNLLTWGEVGQLFFIDFLLHEKVQDQMLIDLSFFVLGRFWQSTPCFK